MHSHPHAENEHWQEALLHQEGDAQSFGPVANLDAFFSRVYSYYVEEGFWCIVLTRLTGLVTLAFTICFSSFLLLFVNWYWLIHCTDSPDLCEQVVRSWSSLTNNVGVWEFLVLTYFAVFSVYWAWNFIRFLYSLRGISEVAHFYNAQLSIPDHLLASTPWPQIVDKIVLSQQTRKLCIVKDLSALDITNRIMRKDNYMIALVNQRLFHFPILNMCLNRCKRKRAVSPLLRPANGTGGRSDQDAKSDEHEKYLVYGKTLEWNLRTCILNSMFDGQFSVRSAFVSAEGVRNLQRQFILMGVLNLMLLPFIMLFMVILFLLENAEEIHSKRTVLGPRQWTPLSQWRIREYNELQHFFQRRLNDGNEAAATYLSLFPSQMQAILAQAAAYISGAVVGTLALFTLLDPDILTAESFRVWDRPLLWWLATMSGILAISRAFIPTRLSNPAPADRAEALFEVTSQVHYLPKRWREHPALDVTRREFALMFQPRVAILLGEILSVLLAPLILCVVLPPRVPELVTFISESTRNVDGVGSLCCFATFELPGQENADEKGNSSPKRKKKKVFGSGKMEKSCLTFALNHPQSHFGNNLGSSVVLSNAVHHLREGRAGRSSILIPRRGRSDESTIAEEDDSPQEDDEKMESHPLSQSDKALMTSFADMFPVNSPLAGARMDDSLDNFFQAKQPLRAEQVPSHLFGVMQRLGEIQDDEDSDEEPFLQQPLSSLAEEPSPLQGSARHAEHAAVAAFSRSSTEHSAAGLNRSSTEHSAAGLNRSSTEQHRDAAPAHLSSAAPAVYPFSASTGPSNLAANSPLSDSSNFSPPSSRRQSVGGGSSSSSSSSSAAAASSFHGQPDLPFSSSSQTLGTTPPSSSGYTPLNYSERRRRSSSPPPST